MEDPFASAPAEDEAQAPPQLNTEESVFGSPPAEAPKRAPAKKAAPKAASEGKVVLTFKGGTGFDAPWIVIHATDLDDALDQVSAPNASTLAKLMERTQTVGQYFASQGKPSNSGGGVRSNAPQAAQEAPAGSPPAPGPDWVFKSGVSKTGKPWKGWMPPRGSDEKPLFF